MPFKLFRRKRGDSTVTEQTSTRLSKQATTSRRMQSDPGPTAGGEKLVIAYDIGTTASGAAYFYRDREGNLSAGGPVYVDTWPGQTPGYGKTPSVLFYYDDGTVAEPWGAQCNTPQYAEGEISGRTIKRVEWFKLHIAPNNVPKEHFSHESRKLPANVSALKVYSDYLRKLHQATHSQIRARLGDDFLDHVIETNKVYYMLTIPVEWKKSHEILQGLSKAAHAAGLTNAEDSPILDFCTEPEASAVHCYNTLRNVSLSPGHVFTVLDAGGGTVDLTSYKLMKTEPHLEMKEVNKRGPRCLFLGATFVNGNFEHILTNVLVKTATNWQERHVVTGMEGFETHVKPHFSNNLRLSAWLPVGNPDEFKRGTLELAWEEVESAFKPIVNRIIQATKEQAETKEGPSQTIFCSGGFGGSPYLRERLQECFGPNVRVKQPDIGSKAVGLGACHVEMYRSVQSVVSSAHYGISIYKDWEPEYDMDSTKREHRGRRRNGGDVLEGIFSPILAMGRDIGTNEAVIADYGQEAWAGEIGEVHMSIYSSDREKPGEYVTDPGTTVLCHLIIDYRNIPLPVPQSSADGRLFYAYEIKVHILLGRTKLKAEVWSKGKMCGNARITVLS